MGKHNRRGWRALTGRIRSNLRRGHRPQHTDQSTRLLPVYTGDVSEAEWLAVQR